MAKAKAKFIGCSVKRLPDEHQVAAAQTAVEVNPANAPPRLGVAMMVTLVGGGETPSPQDMAVLVSKYWGQGGVKLTVGFLESTPADLRDRVLSHMNAWRTDARANVEFTYSSTSPDVRITREGDGYWSYLGTDIRHVAAAEPTMCLEGFTMSTPESEYRRVVRHETGHTCGFPHEHMRKQLVSRLDPKKTTAYFLASQGWSAAVTRQQVLTPLAEASIRGTPDADDTSIMCYALPAQITRDGRPIPGGADINEADAAFARTLYPLAAPPAGRRTIVVDFAAGTLSVDGVNA